MTKKNVLIFGIVGNMALIFLAYIQSGDICYLRDWCNELWGSINLLGEVLFVFIPIFIFSLITYKMRDEIFQAWWNFARWFVPIIIVVTFLLNGGGGGGLGISGAVQSAFNFLIILIFYVIFIIVSCVRIVLTYRRLRREGK